MSSPQTYLVPTTLPGRGDTFLDQTMTPKVRDFIEEAHKRGVDIRFNSAYRTPEQQEQLHHDPTAITPAAHSLHSAGFAVDVEGFRRMSTHDQKAIREAAEAAGLKWGGSFRESDPVHFYAEPPIDRNTAIANATRQYREYQQQHGHPAVDQASASHEQTKSNHAPHDRHTLEQDAHGSAVHDLQTSLASLGYLNTKGIDGDFGIRTRHAIELFQHDHHLTVDGKVGPLTGHAMQAALRERTVAASLTDVRHPDHTLFAQALSGVHALDAQHGRTSDAHSLNLAAALTVEAKREGLTRVDQVTPGKDASRIHAMQNTDSPWTLPKWASVDTMTALHTPIAQSSTLATAIPPPPVEAPALQPVQPAPVQTHAMSR